MNECKQDSRGCGRCAELCRPFSILSPADLSQAIRMAKDNVAAGILVEIPSNPYYPPFSSVNADGPWEDIIGHSFRCTHCGQFFSLGANTYHGPGGAWGPVPRP